MQALAPNATVTIQRGPAAGVGALQTIASGVACWLQRRGSPVDGLNSVGVMIDYLAQFASGVDLKDGDRLVAITPASVVAKDVGPTTTAPTLEVIRVTDYQLAFTPTLLAQCRTTGG